MEHVVYFVLSVAAAIALMAVATAAAYAEAESAQKVLEYAQLRSAWPVLFLAEDGVHACVNSSTVIIYKGNAWMVAKPAILRKDGKGRWHAHPCQQCERRGDEEVYCRNYLGLFKVGDSVTYAAVGRYAAYYRTINLTAGPLRR